MLQGWGWICGVEDVSSLYEPALFGVVLETVEPKKGFDAEDCQSRESSRGIRVVTLMVTELSSDLKHYPFSNFSVTNVEE